MNSNSSFFFLLNCFFSLFLSLLPFSPVNLTDMDTIETQEAFEIFVTFLQSESDDDFIEFLNRTKYLDIIVPLKEIFADLSLLHVACSLGRVGTQRANERERERRRGGSEIYMLKYGLCFYFRATSFYP